MGSTDSVAHRGFQCVSVLNTIYGTDPVGCAKGGTAAGSSTRLTPPPYS